MRTAISHMERNADARQVLVTHQFVTGAERSDSEEISVGGTDNVDVTVFDGFDYVALGHIHRPQRIMRDTVRYCGTPLKYSFSEAGHEKSLTVVELASHPRHRPETHAHRCAPSVSRQMQYALPNRDCH